MGGFTQAVRSALLNHYFGKSTLTPPTIYVGLSTTAPASDGTNVTEPTAGAYARVETAPADWNPAVDGDPCTLDNVSDIEFAVATATWVAGANLAYAVLFDAATNGNVIGYGAVATPKPVYEGDTARYPAGTIDVTLAVTA